jgi:hypothetical protein
MKFFNEILLSIQLPSNNTNASMFTFSSPHLLLPIDYTYNGLGEKYHQLDKLWLNLCGGYLPVLWHFFHEEHDFLYWLLQKNSAFKVLLTFFHHFQWAFITFLNASMFYFPKKLFNGFNNYLLFNLTHGYDISKSFYVWSSPNTCV